MKKTILLFMCIFVFILGLFLVSCQKQEAPQEEAVTEQAGEEEEAVTEAGGYGEKEADTGGY